MLAWNEAEAGKILETYKLFENKPADMIMERTGTQEQIWRHSVSETSHIFCLRFSDNTFFPLHSQRIPFSYFFVKIKMESRFCSKVHEQIIEALTSVPSINKTDATTLIGTHY